MLSLILFRKDCIAIRANKANYLSIPNNVHSSFQNEKYHISELGT